MAVSTLGTTANNSIANALKFLPGYNSGMAAADIATMSQAILDDLINSHPNLPEAFSANGKLYIPNRGVLKMLPGDWVGVDPSGWPILLSKHAITIGGSIWVT